MISILLADDHHLVRRGVRSLLAAEADLSVVGEASDGLEVLQLMETLEPDVLLLDLMMPGMGGLDVLREVVGRRQLETQVVILSMHADAEYVAAALQHGAMGYLLKDCQPQDLVRAVHEVTAGRRYLSPQLEQRACHDDATRPRLAFESYVTLTDRERQVLRLLAEGKTNTQAASSLFISPRTVESHRAAVMRKLGAHSAAELVMFAVRLGILPLH